MSLGTDQLLRTLATNNADAISRRSLLLAALFGSLALALGINRAEAGVIALFGMAPVGLQLVDPSKPAWRRV